MRKNPPNIKFLFDIPIFFCVAKRDFYYGQPDFDYTGPKGSTKSLGLVQSKLQNGYPVLTNPKSGNGHISSAASFSEWFSPDDTVGAPINVFSFVLQGGGLNFVADSFYPLNGIGYEDCGPQGNAYFTLHLQANFSFSTVAQRNAAYFTFGSSDDLWAFIDGTIYSDIGGIHTYSFTSATSVPGGLALNTPHTLDVFYASRSPTGEIYENNPPKIFNFNMNNRSWTDHTNQRSVDTNSTTKAWSATLCRSLSQHHLYYQRWNHRLPSGDLPWQRRFQFLLRVCVGRDLLWRQSERHRPVRTPHPLFQRSLQNVSPSLGHSLPRVPSSGRVHDRDRHLRARCGVWSGAPLQTTDQLRGRSHHRRLPSLSLARCWRA